MLRLQNYFDHVVRHWQFETCPQVEIIRQKHSIGEETHGPARIDQSLSLLATTAQQTCLTFSDLKNIFINFYFAQYLLSQKFRKGSAGQFDVNHVAPAVMVRAGEPTAKFSSFAHLVPWCTCLSPRCISTLAQGSHSMGASW